MTTHLSKQSSEFSFTVRRAEDKDLGALAVMAREGFPTLVSGGPDDLTRAMEALRGRWSQQERSLQFLFVAENESGLIGYIHYKPYSPEDERRLGILSRAIVLNNIYVDKRFRSQGIAKELYSQSLEVVNRLHCGMVVAYTSEETIGFYESIGWNVAETDASVAWMEPETSSEAVVSGLPVDKLSRVKIARGEEGFPHVAFHIADPSGVLLYWMFEDELSSSRETPERGTVRALNQLADVVAVNPNVIATIPLSAIFSVRLMHDAMESGKGAGLLQAFINYLTKIMDAGQRSAFGQRL